MTTTPDPELTITLGEIRRRITIPVKAVDWHVATAPDGTRQIVIVTEDVEDGRRSVVPMSELRAWPLIRPAWDAVEAARSAVGAFYRANVVPDGGKAELATHLATLAAWYAMPDPDDEEKAGIPEGAVVEWDAPVTNLMLGLTTNGPRARRIGRIDHYRADGTVYVIDPDGIALVLNPDELTVIAERAEDGWGNLR